MIIKFMPKLPLLSRIKLNISSIFCDAHHKFKSLNKDRTTAATEPNRKAPISAERNKQPIMLKNNHALIAGLI